jgi:hypothetical protein
MTAARAAVDKATHEIFNQLEALVRIHGIAAYESFIREINAVTERYKNILAQQAGVRKAETNRKEGKNQTSDGENK